MNKIQTELKSAAAQNGRKGGLAFTIRPFLNKDSEQVAKLFQKYFPWQREADTHQLIQRISTHFSQSDTIPSLVCASQGGKIHGSITVKTLDFLFKGKLVKGAICSNFIVDEEARAALIPIRMLQTLLKGPQDFSFSDDATEISRLLWCKLGGETAYAYSNYYTIPLRPFTFFLQLVNKNSPPWVKSIINTIGPGMDILFEATGFNKDHSIKETQYSTIVLNGSSFEKVLSSLIGNYQLFPNLNKEYLENYLASLKEESQYGKLKAKALVNQNQKMIGWFIYYIEQHNRCSVLQSECLPGMEDILIKHLKSDAFNNGCATLSGRTSPSQIGSGYTEHSFNRPGKRWVLIHSKNAELIQAIQSGKALLPSSW